MQIFLDESGCFRPTSSRQRELACVLSVIVPESISTYLKDDFDRFLINLPSGTFKNGEPKGSRLSPKNVKELASLLNRHRGITLAPVTLNSGLIEPSFFESFPKKLRDVLEHKIANCPSDTLRMQIAELAKRCGNLSPEQLVRLRAYAESILRSLNAVSLLYHCKKYHSDYSSFKVVLDRTGQPESREELVFKELLFMWLARMSEITPIRGVKRIHNDSHPFVQLYGVKREDAIMLDVPKMLHGNIEFQDSRESWQLQLADMATAAWTKALDDPRNENGYLPAFCLLHRNTVLPQDQPMGMIGIAAEYSQMKALPEFEIFRKLAELGGKLLPCGWDED